MIILDFETSYTPRTAKGEAPHGLQSQTVPEYLHDTRTACLGAALMLNGVGRYVPPERLDIVLHKVADAVANGTALSCHNAAFDLAVWARFYTSSYQAVRHTLRRYPQRLVDTEHLARWASAQGKLPHTIGTSIAALGDWYGIAKGDTAAAVAAGGDALADYALRDVEIAARVLGSWREAWPDDENALSTLHVLLSTPGAESLRVDVSRLVDTATETPQEAALKKELRKDAVMVELLRRLDVLPEYKITKTGRQKLALSKTDAWAQRLLSHPDERVQKLTSMRLGAASNIDRTRAQTLITASGDGRRGVPMSLRYYAAHTGRSGGSGGLNPQNLPRGGVHRHALVAPAGHRLVVADASQIEVRVLAWLADDQATLEVFRRGGDPYKAFAVDLYGLADEAAVTTEQRRVAKSAVLGLGFGAGALGFQAYCRTMGVEITLPEAERVVRAYRTARPAVPRFWREIEAQARRNAQLVLPSGRVMVYPEMTRDSFVRPKPFQAKAGENTSKLWHGLLTENVVQATARDVTLAAHAVEIGSRWPVVMLVHDEIVCCVPEADVEACLAEMLCVMRTAPSWAAGLPLDAEGAIANNYGECK